MKNRIVKNISASVRAKLLNIAKKSNLDYNRILLLYIQERFLYRLAHSVYKNKFILKGGVLFYAAHQNKARATKDIDLSSLEIPVSDETTMAAIKEIMAIDAYDGIEFLDDSIKTERIVDETIYKGMRVKFNCKLDTAIVPMQIDCGYSDKIVPKPIIFQYPSFFETESIPVRSYSWETIIAEKFEAIVKLSHLNSRMKDFFDIYFLQQYHDFDGAILRLAIEATFKYRQTDIKNFFHVFTISLLGNENKQKQWKAFSQKVSHQSMDSFFDLVSRIQKFLNPIVDAIIENFKFNAKWDSRSQQWIENRNLNT